MAKRQKSSDSDQPVAPAGYYANYIRLRFNLNEVIVDFGQVVPDDKFVRFHTRIVTSPQHLLRFKQQIEAVIRKIGEQAKQANDDKTGNGDTGGRQ